jgi:hypothetical protein
VGADLILLGSAPTSIWRYMTKKSNIVYVVSIPWDSYSVSQTRVFKKRKDAETYCEQKNQGYGGYCGGLFVEACIVEVTKTKKD